MYRIVKQQVSASVLIVRGGAVVDLL